MTAVRLVDASMSIRSSILRLGTSLCRARCLKRVVGSDTVARVVVVLFFLVVLLRCVFELVFGLRSQVKQPLLVLFEPTSGLGNSNLGLLSVAKLASLIAADFAVHWRANSTLAFPVAYSDLYHGAITADDHVINQRCGQACDLDLTQDVLQNCWWSLSCGTVFEIREAFTSCSCLHVKSNMLIPSLFRRFDDKPTLRMLASDLLQTAPELETVVSNVIDSWKSTHKITRIIGVHVRAAFIAQRIENGSFVPKEDIFRKYFLPCLLKVLSFYSDEVTGVFVASDSQQVRKDASKSIAKELPHVVELKSPLRFFPNDFELGPHRTKDACIGAAIELELLKQSQVLIVKKDEYFDSTYSSMAMLLSQCGASNGCFTVSETRCARLSATEVQTNIKTLPSADCDVRRMGRCLLQPQHRD